MADRSRRPSSRTRRVLLLAALLARVAPSSSLTMIAAPWTTTLAAPITDILGLPSPSVPLPTTPAQQPPAQSGSVVNAPAVQLSLASHPDANGVYAPRDPRSIPPGFVRACAKAGGYGGGFAPRPLWEATSHSLVPWYENSSGCFLYFDRRAALWYLDNAAGAGVYLASPEESLLLPPRGGWMSLRGRREGAPRMTFL